VKEKNKYFLEGKSKIFWNHLEYSIFENGIFQTLIIFFIGQSSCAEAAPVLIIVFVR
jgi:hypothetical protein